MTVHLVGAGPGSADLLTLRAARLLSKADVVLYDRLVGSEILDMIAPWAELIDVGKNPDGARVGQDEINRLLIDRGCRFQTVVRLKGGDPFVFGRGGEEAAALIQAGVPVDVVPGITSAIAGPSAVGVPVTHRGVSSGFTVVTANEDPAKSTSLNWEALATLGTTLVVLMGARRAAKIRTRLIDGGMAPSTPVTIVIEATTERQRQIHLDLADLGTVAVPNPAVIVIGDVADPALLHQLPQDQTRQSPTPAASLNGDPSSLGPIVVQEYP